MNQHPPCLKTTKAFHCGQYFCKIGNNGNHLREMLLQVSQSLVHPSDVAFVLNAKPINFA
jgi:hypothetical protein